MGALTAAATVAVLQLLLQKTMWRQARSGSDAVSNMPIHSTVLLFLIWGPVMRSGAGLPQATQLHIGVRAPPSPIRTTGLLTTIAVQPQRELVFSELELHRLSRHSAHTDG